jgi:membrane-bound serine protease (ClpP class)
MIARDLPALLDRADGRTTKPKGTTLHTAGAEITTVHMGLWKQILDTLIDPQIIVLMMSIGLLGIVVELWNPGMIFPGTVGAISLVIGLYGLQVLPISWAGLLLMLLAAAFIGAEPFVPSHGALAVAGAVCFALGALLLFEPAGPLYEVSVPFVLAMSGTIAAMTLFLVWKIVQVRRRPVEVGIHSVVGAHGVVRRDGLVFVNGELWRARPEDGTALSSGAEVEITGIDEGLVLIVRPLREAAPVS